MNYIQDFANWLWYPGGFVLSGVMLQWLTRLDEELRGINRKQLACIWFVSCGVAELIIFNSSIAILPMQKFFCLLLILYLVIGTVMDVIMEKVSDFLQYVGMGGGVLLLLTKLPPREIGISLIGFALIQYFLFQKMYGRADVMGFLVCAVYLAAQNKGIEAYLLHMAGCFCLLAMVQGLKGNINEKGNLKHPVPLYPYILTSFLLFIYR